MDLTAGASATVELTVAQADTAVALGSGDVPVLGTPRVLALVEEATVRAIQAGLAETETSVGTQVALDHLSATPIGRTVRAAASLVEVDGRRLLFDVTVFDVTVADRSVADDSAADGSAVAGSVADGPGGSALVARGQIHRVVVDRQRFLDRIQAS